MKSLLDRLLAKLGYKRALRTRPFELSAELHDALVTRAGQEGRPEGELYAELLAEGLAQRQDSERVLARWRRLSQRQQDVTALACLGYTNKEIGLRLHISPDTAKSYLQNAMYKFAARSKTELRLLFSGWDFSAWEPPQK
jgi:DNA-binding CsgD family transcriptional regulator